MTRTKYQKYGVGVCPVCHRGLLALTKDGLLRPHNEGVPWSKRKCPNRQAHLTPDATDGGYAPPNGAFDLPHAIDCVRKRYGLPPAAADPSR